MTTQQFSQVKNPSLQNTYTVNNGARQKLWLGYADKLVIADSGLTLQKTFSLNVKETNSVINVHQLNNGKIVVVTANDIFYFDTQSGHRSPVADAVSRKNNQSLYFSYSFYHPGTNVLYAGGWTSGSYKIDFNTNHVTNLQGDKTSPLYAQPVNTIFKDSRNRLWVGTINGLLLYDETSNVKNWIYQSTDNDGLTDNHVRCVLEDREKNIWIGTINGLNKLSEAAQSIRYIRKELETGNRKAEIYDITQLSNNDIIIATYGNGLFRLNETTGNVQALPQPYMTHTWVVKEIENKLYAGGHQQLLISEPGKYFFQPASFLKPFYKNTNLVLLAYEDKAGDIWYSMNGSRGLVRQLAGTNQFVHYNNEQNPKPFAHNYFNAIAEDENGNIWWGVNKFSDPVKWNRARQQFETIDLAGIFNRPGKMKRGINCLFYEDGHLWIGTDGAGLYDYDIKNNNIREYTINDGISGENVTQIISDNLKRLWIGTRKGLSCLLPDRKTFINFSLSEGLPEIAFNDGACFYNSKTNRLYMATQHSLLLFNPDELLGFRSGPASVFADEIFINGKKNTALLKQPVRLKHDQNNIQVNFSAIEFTNTRSLQIEYKLEGGSNQWLKTGQQRTISLLNLNDGNYTLHLRVKKPINNEWNELPGPIRFTILPPVWETWWFISLVGLLLSGLLVITIRSYYRRRIEEHKMQLEKQRAVEAERNRIAADMHDDLGAGVTRLKFLAEDMEDHLPAGADAGELLKLKNSANEVVEKMSEIIWAMNEKNNSWDDLIFYIRAYSAQYLLENKINCSFRLPPSIPQTMVSGETRRNIFLTVKECLHNVVKHAGAKNVWIEMTIGKNLTIQIRDDGAGFEMQDILPKSNGLINMKKRISGMHGTIEWKRNNGTEVFIALPV
jgi:signal transduction histidine kinase